MNIGKKQFLARYGNADHIDKAGALESDDIAYEAAQNPLASDAQIDHFSKSPDVYVRRTLADHPKIKAHHIDNLLNLDGIRRFVSSFAKNSISETLSKNPHLTSDGISKVIKHTKSHIAFSNLLKRHDITKEHIDQIVNHPLDEARHAAALSDRISPEHIEKLVNDEDFTTRGLVCENPNISFEHLDTLSRDSDPTVRDTAKYFHSKKSVRESGKI